MPIQIFPPKGQAARRHAPAKGWLKVTLVLGSLVVLGILGMALLPYALLNTEVGRALLLAMANRTNDGHLALKDSALTLSPVPMLVLEGVRLVQPFESAAPKLALGRAELVGFELAHEEDSTVVVAESARFDQVSLEAQQVWIQQQQAGRKPPALPPQLPSRVRVETLEVTHMRYEIHQLRRGRPTLTQLEGVSARFSPLLWDLKRMQATGTGRLHAEHLTLGSLRLRDLSIPNLVLEGERIRIPSGTAQGLGGAISLAGELSLKSGVPLPHMHITGRGLELGQVILAAPDAKTDRPSPVGTLSMDIQLTTEGNPAVGEVPDPVIEGTIVLEDLSVPLTEKSALAKKVLEKSPLWAGSNPPRLNLGDMVATIRVADGKVRLTQARLTIKGLTLVMAGTIDQNTDALQLRLKLAPKGSDVAPMPKPDLGVTGLEAPTASDARDAERAASQAEQAALDTGSGAEPGTGGSEAPPAAAPLQDAPGLRAKLAAGRLGLQAKADETRLRFAEQAEQLKEKAALAKADFDTKAEALKEQVSQDLNEARQDRKERQESLKSAADAGPEALKAELDARVEGLRTTIQTDFEGRMARVQERFETIGGRVLERFSPRLETLELCITGTTAQPIVQLCQESNEHPEHTP